MNPDAGYEGPRALPEVRGRLVTLMWQVFGGVMAATLVTTASYLSGLTRMPGKVDGLVESLKELQATVKEIARNDVQQEADIRVLKAQCEQYRQDLKELQRRP